LGQNASNFVKKTNFSFPRAASNKD